MGRKGDGKQRRPKAQPESSGPPPPPPSTKPARISGGGAAASHTVSVRKQIALVRAFESASQRRTRPSAVRTSFRKREKTNSRAGRGDDEKVRQAHKHSTAHTDARERHAAHKHILGVMKTFLRARLWYALSLARFRSTSAASTSRCPSFSLTVTTSSTRGRASRSDL